MPGVGGGSGARFMRIIIIMNVQNISQIGLGALFAWAVINIVAGLFMSRRTTGTRQAFWRMTTWWNMVNFVVAGLALAGIMREAPPAATAIQTFKFNTAFDAAYIMTGVILTRSAKPNIVGYGWALIPQGAFLFLVDAAMVLAISFTVVKG